MITGITSVISWLGTILSFILALQIPNGDGGYITMRSIFLFMFLFKLSVGVIKMFLTKDHLDNLEYERQERRERVRNARKQS